MNRIWAVRELAKLGTRPAMHTLRQAARTEVLLTRHCSEAKLIPILFGMAAILGRESPTCQGFSRAKQRLLLGSRNSGRDNIGGN